MPYLQMFSTTSHPPNIRSSTSPLLASTKTRTWALLPTALKMISKNQFTKIWNATSQSPDRMTQLTTDRCSRNTNSWAQVCLQHYHKWQNYITNMMIRYLHGLRCCIRPYYDFVRRYLCAGRPWGPLCCFWKGHLAQFPEETAINL